MTLYDRGLSIEATLGYKRSIYSIYTHNTTRLNTSPLLHPDVNQSYGLDFRFHKANPPGSGPDGTALAVQIRAWLCFATTVIWALALRTF